MKFTNLLLPLVILSAFNLPLSHRNPILNGTEITTLNNTVNPSATNDVTTEDISCGVLRRWFPRLVGNAACNFYCGLRFKRGSCNNKYICICY